MANIKYKTERQARAAQQKNLAKWQKENTVSVHIRFFAKGDSDVIQKLKSVENKADYIRKLIRADIVANGID